MIITPADSICTVLDTNFPRMIHLQEDMQIILYRVVSYLSILSEGDPGTNSLRILRDDCIGRKYGHSDY